MPLVRFQVRNEYGLGDPGLYGGPAKREDPKALLDGVAVAGLVGILRQLGDLAEFAADVFHDLHEQVAATTARGRKMMVRIHHIEAALPTIERAVQNQKSHDHFAYVAGSEWHSIIQIEHDLLRHTDLPRFVMDSYEECRDPPHLYLLDRFDSAGSGSGACLRRYSDPTFFKRVYADLESGKAEKIQKVRKNRKIKKKISRLRDEVQHVMPLSHHTNSLQGTSPGTDGLSIASETLSTSDMRLKSELESRSTSFDSRTRISFVEPVFDMNLSAETESLDYTIAPVTATADEKNVQNADADDDFYSNYFEIQSHSGSSWNKKVELVKPIPKSRFLSCPFIDVSGQLAPIEPEYDSSSKLDESHIDAGDANKPEKSYVEGHDEVDDDGDGGCSCQGSFLEQHISSPSSVTWDEKAEKMVPSGNKMPFDLQTAVQGSGPHSFAPVSYKQETEGSAYGRTEEDFHYGSAGTQAQLPANSHTDEIISETENYVDASNTLDSEIETDSEFQTIKELMPLPNSTHQQFMDDNMKEVGALPGTYDIKDSPSANVSPKKDASQVSTLVLPRNAGFAKAQTHIDGSSDSFIDDGHEKAYSKTPQRTTPDETTAENLTSHSMVSSSQEVLELVATTTKTQHTQLSKACDGPTKFWTNGGLLGLEPSKPPDFNTVSSIFKNSLSTSYDIGCDFLKEGGDASSNKSDEVVSSKVTQCRSGGSNFVSTASHYVDMHSRISVSDACNTVFPSKPSFSFFHGEKNDCISTGSPYGDEDSVSLNGAVSSGQRGLSSSLTSLTRKLLSSSLQKKEALTHFHTRPPSDTIHSDSMHLQNISIESDKTIKFNSSISQEILEPNVPGKTELGSSGNISSALDCSGHSSPPLEQMKISFHPINGLETSKLRLQFPSSHLLENIEELMFPSFQLLPGPNVTHKSICSESDDDTFSKSYSHSQEDVTSLHSDSDSDCFVQNDMSGSEDLDIHDGSRRFSSLTASISGSLDPEGVKHGVMDKITMYEKLGRENQTAAFPSGPFLKFSNSYSSVCALALRGGKYASSIDKPPHPSNNQSSPPTHPSFQWRTVRPSIQVDENSNEEIRYSGEAQFKSSVSLCLSEREVPKPTYFIESGICRKITKHSGSSNLNDVPEGGKTNERQDFLHQIRNKTFKLHPSVTSRPSLVPKSSTDVKVAAILAKAKAIRQAFGSSDEGGDDETWSDC